MKRGGKWKRTWGEEEKMEPLSEEKEGEFQCFLSSWQVFRMKPAMDDGFLVQGFTSMGYFFTFTECKQSLKLHTSPSKPPLKFRISIIWSFRERKMDEYVTFC